MYAMWSIARSFSMARAPTRELRDLAEAGAAELRLDLVRRAVRGVVGDGAPRQGLREAVGELVAVELLAGAVALDDDEAGRLDALVGGEPGAAGGALPAAADRRRLIEVARVHDPRVTGAALRAAHRPSIVAHHNR